MLAVARRQFGQESYENVGLREIAREVGVDVALVGRYFGSKEELFREVLRAGKKDDILPADIEPQDIARHLARLFLSHDDDPNENVERLMIILRSASSPAASQVVCEALHEDVLLPFAQRLSGARPEARASAAMAVWMGMTVLRTVIAVEPMCEQSPEFAAKLEALFEAALAETPQV